MVEKMIIAIKTWREKDKPKIYTKFDSIEKEEPRYDEVCMAIFELEKIKQELLELEFEPEFKEEKVDEE